MKWIRLDIPDWVTAVRDLPLVDQAVYMNLLLWQYQHEAPLPTEYDALVRAAGVHHKHEHAALDRVVQKFFPDVDGAGMVNPRAWAFMASLGLRVTQMSRDSHVTTALSRDVTADGTLSREKPVTDRMRQRALRERKTRMFDALDAKGIHPAASTTVRVLRDLCIEHGVPVDKNGECHVTVTTKSRSHAGALNTYTATNATKAQSARPVALVARDSNGSGSPAAQACKTMIEAGISPLSVNTGHPKLLALIEAGCTREEFAGAAAAAVAKGKGYAYALAMLEGQRRDQQPIGTVDLLALWAPGLAAARDAASDVP